MSSAQERLAALKARVAAATSAKAGGAIGSSSGGGIGNRPSHGLSSGREGNSSFGGSSLTGLTGSRDSTILPTGGLNVPLHPALENIGALTYTSRSTANKGGGKDRDRRRGQSSAPAANPYLESDNASVAAAAGVDAEAIEAAAAAAAATATAPPVKRRQPRQLMFNEKGKYVQQGNAMRRQAALEAMKMRIAEQARKASADDVPGDKNYIVEEPPEVEWVDQGYFAEGKTYADLLDISSSSSVLLFFGDESIITDLVQHPIPIEPPQDKLVPPPKPMYLTKLEQKKMRRQRRLAEQKERQAKIRLGLMPAPAPKVKRSNLMRVLGEEAVQDPTAVETRVNREIEARRLQHLGTNEARQLTSEQRHEKLMANQEKDAAKGIHMLIFRIPSLTNGQHRFKIWKNADQLALTGVCIMHPKMNLVVVEGGQYSINKYRKLMLNRIDWTANTPAVATLAPDTTGSAIGAAPTLLDTAAKGPTREWLASQSEVQPHNRAELLFDGETKGRAFRKWSSKICDTDRDAYDFLARSKLESFWTEARKDT